jgi:hypothetical protein
MLGFCQRYVRIHAEDPIQYDQLTVPQPSTLVTTVPLSAGSNSLDMSSN